MSERSFDQAITYAQERIQGSYEAVSDMGGSVPSDLSSQTTYNLPTAIRSIPKGQKEHRYAVQSDIEWNDDWQEKGLSGTVFDVVVGDSLAPRLSVAVVVGNNSASDPATIYWGDGTTSTMARNTTETRIYHAYPSAGHYELRINDKAKHIYFLTSNPSITSLNNQIIYDTRYAIRRLQQIGSKITNLYCICFGLVWCNSPEGGYPGYLPAIPLNVTTIDSAFTYLNFYAEDKIPRIDHLTKCASVRQAFRDMYNCKADMQKLPPNARTCESVYYGWRGATYIPYDIFDLAASNLTATQNCFYQCYKAEGEFPIISNLTATYNMSYMFYYCLNLGAGYDLPTLPYASNLTAFQDFMCECGSATGTNDLSIAAHFPNIKNMYESFYNCRCIGCKAELPPKIETVNGLYRTFCNCFQLSGGFPDIPSDYVGSLYGTFYQCYNLSGQMPELPAGCNNLYATFHNCINATGRFPSLGHLTSFNGVDCVRNTFYNCYNVEEEPLTFFNPTSLNASNATNFYQMFYCCNKLKSFSHSLSSYTKINSTYEMFRECRSLSYAKMDFPPNLLTANGMYYWCSSLSSNISQWPSKLTNASTLYVQCDSLGPMLDADGNVETTPSKIYNSKLVAYTNLVNSASPAVQKQFYDALVASGKSGTLYGGTNGNW